MKPDKPKPRAPKAKPSAKKPKAKAKPAGKSKSSPSKPEPKVKGKRKVDSQDSKQEEEGRDKCFARRYKPTRETATLQWMAIRDAFNDHLRQTLLCPSKLEDSYDTCADSVSSSMANACSLDITYMYWPAGPLLAGCEAQAQAEQHL